MPWDSPLLIDYPFVPASQAGNSFLATYAMGFLLISCPVCSLEFLSLFFPVCPLNTTGLWASLSCDITSHAAHLPCEILSGLLAAVIASVNRWVPNRAVKFALLYWAPDPYIQLYTGWALLLSMLLERKVAFNQMPVNGGRWWTHCPYKATSQDSALAEHFYWWPGRFFKLRCSQTELIFSPPHTNLPLVGFVSFASF